MKDFWIAISLACLVVGFVLYIDSPEDFEKRLCDTYPEWCEVDNEGN